MEKERQQVIHRPHSQWKDYDYGKQRMIILFEACYMDSGMLYKMTISLIPKSENKARIAGAT